MFVRIISFLLILGFQGEPKTSRWNFNDEPVGATPREFTVAAGKWTVKGMSEGRKALVQEAKSPDDVFNLALLNDIKAKDLEITVHIHALTGENDLGGGVVWRAKDAKNYYIARYNPLEDNFRLYKVVDGVRTQLDTFDIAHKRRQFDLQVIMKGTHIVCKLDGEVFLEADDATFKDAGAIGFWSKSDASSAFDDLVLKEL